MIDNVVAHYFMKYENLTVGNLRKQGDQVRARDKGRGVNAKSTDPRVPDDWQNVSLLGWPILHSDTMHAEFCRPLKESGFANTSASFCCGGES